MKFDSLDVRDWKVLRKIFSSGNTAEDFDYYSRCIFWTARRRTLEQIKSLKAEGWIFEEAHEYPRSAINLSTKGGIDFDTNRVEMLEFEHDVKHALDYLRDGKLKDFKRQEISKSRAAKILDLDTKKLKWSSNEDYQTSIKLSEIDREREKARAKADATAELAKKKLFFSLYGVSNPGEVFISLGKTGTENLEIITLDNMVSGLSLSSTFIQKLVSKGTNTNSLHGVYCTVPYLKKNRPSDYERIKDDLLKYKESDLDDEIDVADLESLEKEKDTTSRKMRLRLAKAKIPINVYAIDDKSCSKILYSGINSTDLARVLKDAGLTGDYTLGAVEKRISNGVVMSKTGPVLDLGAYGSWIVKYDRVPREDEVKVSDKCDKFTEEDYRRVLSIV